MLWCISPFICFDLLKMARNCLALNFTSIYYPKPIFVEYFLLNILRQGYPGEDIFIFVSPTTLGQEFQLLFPRHGSEFAHFGKVLYILRD